MENNIIPLTQGKVTLVDAEDYELLNRNKWHINNCGYAVRTIPVGDKDRKLLMHRVILNPHEGCFVDHINGDPLDNRRSNLRLATKSQNGRNRGIPKNNTTGYKGVHFYKPRAKFIAYITVFGKRKNLGYFMFAEDAARAYDRAAREIHGEFAWQNFGDVL